MQYLFLIVPYVIIMFVILNDTKPVSKDNEI